jgi:TonB family protein
VFVVLTVLVLIAAAMSTGCSGADDGRGSNGDVSVPRVSYDTVFAEETVDRAPDMEEQLQEWMRHVDYPIEAKREGITGRVIIGFVVSPEGKPTNVEIVRSVHPILDTEAMRALSVTEFSPGVKDGRPVPVYKELPVTFNIR